MIVNNMYSNENVSQLSGTNTNSIYVTAISLLSTPYDPPGQTYWCYTDGYYLEVGFFLFIVFFRHIGRY